MRFFAVCGICISHGNLKTTTVSQLLQINESRDENTQRYIVVMPSQQRKINEERNHLSFLSNPNLAPK